MSDDRKIIRYLDGEMTVDERLRFEEDISANPDLAREVETLRKLQQVAGNVLGKQDDPERNLDQETRDEIRQAVIDFKEGKQDALPEEVSGTIQDARQAYEQQRGQTHRKEDGEQEGIPRSGIRQIRRIWFSAAAVAVLAAVISILIFRPFHPKPVQDLYVEYYREYTLTEEISDLSRTDDDLLFALKVYEAGDFERAVVLFEMLADSTASPALPLFYAGHSYLHMNRTDKAIDTFRSALTDDPNDLESAIRWYLALSYLRIGEAVMSKEQLVQIEAGNSTYRRIARRLLRDLP